MSDTRPDGASVLDTLFRHNTWANLKLLDFCARLSDEQLGATARGAHGSVRATLAHLVGSQVDYAARITGKTLPAWLSGDQFPGFEVLKASARDSGEELAQLAAGAQAGALVRETDPGEGIAVEYPLGSLLTQAINHANEHREQVSAIITQLGITPPGMDGWAYMEETGQFREFPCA